ncbi:MAG: SDR family NAD(P)-dependent oxidoreductase [Pseudomonadota bacterium]
MKRAFVTGASAGIGREFATRLAAEGYAVTAVARREDRLQALVQALAGDGHRYVVADLASHAGREAVIEDMKSAHVDLLVNNAGFSALEPFYQSSLQKQRDILGVDCQAVVELAHAFLAQAKRGDALVNLGSIVSYLPTPAQPVYSASKAFVAAFSECLWEEQRERGVYVMCLCPGLTETDFVRTASGGDADGSNLPSGLTQTTDAVTDEALGALRRRHKAIVVTGWFNRLMLLMPRLLTRHRLIKVLAVMGDPAHAKEDQAK